MSLFEMPKSIDADAEMSIQDHISLQTTVKMEGADLTFDDREPGRAGYA